MRKFLSRFLITTVIVSLLSTVSVLGVSETSISKEENNEILVKYRSNSNPDFLTIRQEIINKVKPRKFEKRKSIRISEKKFEVLRLDPKDDIDKVIITLKKNPTVEYAVKNHRVKIKKDTGRKPRFLLKIGY